LINRQTQTTLFVIFRQCESRRICTDPLTADIPFVQLPLRYGSTPKKHLQVERRRDQTKHVPAFPALQTLRRDMSAMSVHARLAAEGVSYGRRITRLRISVMSSIA